MKRGFGVGATLLLGVALVLSGCGQSGNSDSKSTAGTKKPVTFTLFTSDATEDLIFDDPVAKAITEKTGVTLKIDHPVGGDTQAIPLMIASGEYPDLIYAKGDLTKLIDAGAVIPLDDLIAKKGKNLKKLYGDQLVRLKNSVADPHIYSVGTYDVNAGIWETDGTMQLQHAVLKELGYPKIQTLDDYEAALKAYIAKYPTIDGKKTIGLSLLIDTWQWYIDLSNPSGFITGHPDDGQWFIDDSTFEAQYKFLSPEVVTYYKWLNKLNAEGLLDPESFTQKEDVWKAKIASGRVLGLAYPIWGYGDSRSALINDGKEDRTYAYLPVAADASYASKVPSLKNYGFGGGWGIAISSKCKDPERAFEFLDWMCSEEAQVLINWGI
jgi:putative aldouronate transport system substrate-binding protein